MSKIQPDQLRNYYSPESHYLQIGKLFDRDVRSEALAISNRAYQNSAKISGSIRLSPNENIIYLSLLETWLAADQEIRLETDYTNDFGTIIAVGDIASFDLPIHKSGVRWLVEVFLAGCAEGPSVERSLFAEEYKYKSTTPLLGASALTLYCREEQEPATKPFSPNLVVLTAPDFGLIQAF